jgi:NarL family two-component system response regulator LiaR
LKETPLQVLLIDDHPLLSYGLVSCLEETGRFYVCGQAGSLEKARQLIKELTSLPSLIILDILLGEENGLDFLPFLQDFCKTKNIPQPPVLVCSVLEDPFRIQTALKLGACGYVPKTGDKAELLHAIDTVLGGKVYITGRHTVKLDESSVSFAELTKREREVLNLIKLNKTNREIATALAINIRTVENNISKIYFKTVASNRQELLTL